MTTKKEKRMNNNPYGVCILFLRTAGEGVRNTYMDKALEVGWK